MDTRDTSSAITPTRTMIDMNFAPLDPCDSRCKRAISFNCVSSQIKRSILFICVCSSARVHDLRLLAKAPHPEPPDAGAEMRRR